MTKKSFTTVSIGEILWDILPDKKVLGGAPANVAWHISQLGAEANIISAVGNDKLGLEIIDNLKKMRLSCETIEIVAKYPTSTVDAFINEEGSASYKIHENVAWDYLTSSEKIKSLIEKADAINFGSLAQRTRQGREITAKLISYATKECYILFDINLRKPFIYKEILEAGLNNSNVLKLNDEELNLLIEKFSLPDSPMLALETLIKKYSNLKHIIVTRGAKGAWWINKNNFFSFIGKNIKVVDTIGAGDSFTAVIIMGLLNKLPEPVIAEAAFEVAAFVCSQAGATPIITPEIRKKLPKCFSN